MDHRFSLMARYNHNMMQIPSPKFVNSLANEPNLQQLTSQSCELVDAAYGRALKPLPSSGQPKSGDRNFFAQAFVTGAVLLAVPCLVGSIGAIAYGARKVYRSWR